MSHAEDMRAVKTKGLYYEYENKTYDPDVNDIYFSGCFCGDLFADDCFC